MQFSAQRHVRVLKQRLLALLRLPVFWIVSITVNSMAVVGTVAFHYFEHNVNPEVKSWLDSFGWSVGLITTVGFGHVVPITTEGKVLSIIMMIIGSIVLWSYMAFFVSAFISPEIAHLERELTGVEKELRVALKEKEGAASRPPHSTSDT